MKNRIITGACGILLLLGMTSAMAAGTVNGVRGGAQLAFSDVSGLNTGLAAVLTGIFPMPEVHPEFTVEGEFTTTVNNPDDSQSSPFGKISVELSYYTLAGYGVWNHKVTPTVTFKARVGLLYENLKEKSTVFGFSSTNTDTNIEVSYGVGAVFDIKKNFDIIAEYTVIENDISHLGAGVQWYF